MVGGTACVLATLLLGCRAQTEEDENRPYKFAFAIEGYQHRSEEKDEKGIIMGEFGFVTGDGVYHVTVYATDENGDFKILSMKNFYIGLPGEGTTVAPTRAPAPQNPEKSAILKHLEGLMGCGGCIVPDKTGAKPGVSGGKQPMFKGADGIDVRFGASPGTSGGPLTPGVDGGKPAYNLKPPGGNAKQTIGNKGTNSPAGSVQKSTGGGGILPNPPGGSGPTFGTQAGQTPPGSPQYKPSSGGLGSQYPQSPKTTTGGQGSRTGGISQTQNIGGPSTFEGSKPSQGIQGTSQGQGFGAPSLSEKSPQPGRPQYKEGLPPGMTMDDLMGLLYKFNYTLKYHGHHESGYRNGDKEGGYFFNGRDGLGRDVKYLANEFGFQPNITLVDLGLQAPDTPKEVNEEPNELRGNEFKWFYKR